MTPTKLKTYGEFLHGEYWMRPLARDLHINDRTVRRWASGEFEIPDRIESELIHLCAAQYVKLKLLKRPIPPIYSQVKKRAQALIDFLNTDE